jgi:hypothetical protein
MDPQKTPLPAVPLLLCAYLLLRKHGTDCTENIWLRGVTVLFPNRCPCWLHSPVFQQVCHNIYGDTRNVTRILVGGNGRIILTHFLPGSLVFSPCQLAILSKCVELIQKIKTLLDFMHHLFSRQYNYLLLEICKTRTESHHHCICSEIPRKKC